MPDSVTQAAAARAAFAARAPGHFDRLSEALAAAPGDAALLLDHAAAAAEQGCPEPFARLEAALVAAPGWAEGHFRLAQLRIEFGEPEPLAGIDAALRERPDDPRLWHAYLRLLSALERHGEAAAHAAALRRRIGDVPGLRLLEARYAGLAGAADHAAALLSGLPEDLPELGYQRVRNALQRGAADAAAALLDRLAMGEDMRLWALAELAWRATGDPRHAGLMPGEALLATFAIALGEAEFAALVAALRAMHRTRIAPPAQSLRGGTQTRGQLHLRAEAELAPLFAGFADALAAYSRALAPLAPGHPLAALARRPAAITASWSVRLTGGGFHIPHIHSEGRLSSACHLIAPADAPAGEGVLEIGRPPPDIPLTLEPLARFAPVPGRLVLFPSFLYHATSPFAAGERLTAVFDAV